MVYFDDTPSEASFRHDARAWLEDHAIRKGDGGDFSGGFFDPAADKVYRHPTFYDVPDDVEYL